MSSCDLLLLDELHTNIQALPLPASSAVVSRQDDLDRIGTELWNLSTRLRRNEQSNGQINHEASQKMKVLSLLRVFAFLLLDTANAPAKSGRARKSCVRLMKVALKAARICLENCQLGEATEVFERAAEYQEALSTQAGDERCEEIELGERLCIEYFALRATLVSWMPF